MGVQMVSVRWTAWVIHNELIAINPELKELSKNNQETNRGKERFVETQSLERKQNIYSKEKS